MMSRTTLSLVLVAAIAVVFVFSRYTNNFNMGEFGAPQPISAKEDAQFNSWIPYTSKNQSFKVKFPRQPEYISQNSRDATNRYLKHYEMYAVNGLDSTAYIIQEITFPNGDSPLKDPDILKNSLNDILAMTKSKLIKSNEDATFQGNKALTFEIESASKFIQGVMFAKGEVLYILSRTINEKNRNENHDYHFFLDSFKLNENLDY